MKNSTQLAIQNKECNLKLTEAYSNYDFMSNPELFSPTLDDPITIPNDIEPESEAWFDELENSDNNGDYENSSDKNEVAEDNKEDRNLNLPLSDID